MKRIVMMRAPRRRLRHAAEASYVAFDLLPLWARTFVYSRSKIAAPSLSASSEARGAATHAVALGDLIEADAVLLLAVEVGIAGMARLDRRL